MEKKAMFTQAEFHHWSEILLRLRDRLDVDSAHIRAEATHPSDGESAGGLSNRPLHLADLGSRESEARVNIALAENEAMLVAEVEDALVRIDEQRFGICEACREPIPATRLKALPYARYCISCAEKFEHR